MGNIDIVAIINGVYAYIVKGNTYGYADKKNRTAIQVALDIHVENIKAGAKQWEEYVKQNPDTEVDPNYHPYADMEVTSIKVYNLLDT